MRYAFLTDWTDDVASQVRKYTVCFYPEDNTAEIIDMKQKRIFLRRSKVPNALSEFFIGGAINIHGRQHNVTGYADNFTAQELGNRLERTLLVVKPDAVAKLSEILSAIASTGLSVVNAKMVSGSGVGLEIVGNNAVSAVSALAGPADPSQARSEAPNSLRARFGTSASNNAVETGSDADIARFFTGPAASSLGPDSALCVVKPSLFGRNASSFAKVVGELAAGGFRITGLVSRSLSRAAAEEFLEVYKGVVGEYSAMVDELTSGPCLALEVSGGAGFRDFCGPSDPEIAKQLRPNTLRAKFGEDKVRNGFHCTDLAEDIGLELEYFFKVLA